MSELRYKVPSTTRSYGDRPGLTSHQQLRHTEAGPWFKVSSERLKGVVGRRGEGVARVLGKLLVPGRPTKFGFSKGLLRLQ